MQEKLNSLGYTIGTVDGDFGKRTEGALKDFQRDNGIAETGALDTETRTRLYADGTGEFPAPRGAFAVHAAAVEPADTSIHGYLYYIDNCGWEEANRRAYNMGGHLVSIDSLSEYAELQSEILELQCADVAFWIGAHRSHHTGHNSYDFFWMDDDGIPYLDPIDFDNQLGGLNPWALGKPRYRNEFGEELLYVHMRYNSDELRWIWEDALDKPEEEGRTGYIVELADAASLSGLTTLEMEALPSPVLIKNPAAIASEVGMNYGLEILGLEGNSVLARVTTDTSCQIDCYFWDAEHRNELFYVWDYVEGGLKNRLIRVAIPEENYNKLPRNFVMEGILYNYDATTDTSLDYTDWVRCNRYQSGNEGNTPVRQTRKRQHETEEKAVWRVTTVLASDPTALDPTVPIEIYDEDSNLIATVYPGATIYLIPGNYTAKMPGKESADIEFTVTDGPVIAQLQDAPLFTVAGHAINAETGTALQDTKVTLEVQGRKRTMVTDVAGAFTFEDVPGVDARLTIDFDEEIHFVPYVNDIHIGAEAQNTEVSAQPMPSVTFYGYLHDGSAEANAACDAFDKKIDEGYYGPPQHDYWIIFKTLYVTVESIIDSTDSIAVEGSAFNVQGDKPQEKVNRSSTQANSEFMEEYGLDPATCFNTLMKIKGYIRKDNMKENNLHYDEWFLGWSDKLIEIESIEPVN